MTEARRWVAWSGSLLIVCAAVACKPDLAGRPSVVDTPRVLAIRSEPAEVTPGTDVSYDALVVGPGNDSAELQLNWALCHARKPIAESGPIAGSCLQATGSDLEDLGDAATVSANIPTDACQIYGPATPVQKPGEPTVRPEDPDTTGGYYQPVRLLTFSDSQGEQYDVGVTRISCGIALGASQENTVRFTKEYHANTNPAIDSVQIDAGDGELLAIDLAGSPISGSVKVGATARFEVSWSACPTQSSEDACPGAEPYLNYDSSQQTLSQRRESIRLSWFATAGTFEHDRTGRSEDEADTPNTTNRWTAPATATRVRFWLVIRDDRRGVGWSTFELEIVP
jgi:hypothetical protein